MRFLLQIFFIIIFVCCNIFCNDENRQTVESIDGTNVDWLTFLKNYVAKGKPVILRKAFRHTFAYKVWSPDYIKYNRGFVFFNFGSDVEPVSIRRILNYRDIYLRFTMELPWIMRKDLMLPKMLDCDLLVKNMGTPLFRWEFHDWVQPIHGNSHSQDELVCSVLNSKKIILISDWTAGMLDRTIEDILKDEPDLENSLYELELRAGDCAFLPSNMVRHVVHKSDGIGIVFQIDHKLTNITQYPYETCNSLGESKTLQKIHFGLEKDTTDLSYWTIVEVFLRKLSQYTQCITKETFINSLYFEKETIEQREGTEDEANDLFKIIDVDKNGYFCWSDVDSLSYDKVVQLANSIQEKYIEFSDKLDAIKREEYETV